MHFNILLFVTVVLLSTTIAFPIVPSKRNARDDNASSLGLRFDNGYEETVDLSRRATTTTPAPDPATSHGSNSQTPVPSTSRSKAASSSETRHFEKDQIPVVDGVTFTPKAYDKIWAVALSSDSDINPRCRQGGRDALIAFHVHWVRSAMMQVLAQSAKILDISDIVASCSNVRSRLDITVNFYTDKDRRNVIHEVPSELPEVASEAPKVEQTNDGTIHVYVPPKDAVLRGLAIAIKGKSYVQFHEGNPKRWGKNDGQLVLMEDGTKAFLNQPAYS